MDNDKQSLTDRVKERRSGTDCTISDAKINLYAKLLAISPNDMTDTEIEIMYYLSQDHQVHEHIRKSMLG